VTDPLVTIDPARLSVEPGGQASVAVSISNPGTIVEGYDLDVVGEPPITWARVIPSTVSVYPHQQETATVVFTPPSGPAAPGGPVPFGIRARSQVDPASSAVAEGDLDIGRVFGLQAKLTPVTSSGRWRGRHTIQISNWGNAPARLRLVASDPNEALGFLVRPDDVDVPLGGNTSARLTVRTRKPMLRGTAVPHQFQVAGEPDQSDAGVAPAPAGFDPRRPVVDGAFTQKPILSRGVIIAGVLAGVAMVAGTAFALTRPEAPQTFEEKGRPPAPTDLVVASSGPDSLTLAWTGVLEVEKYQLQSLDPDSKNVMGTQDLARELDQFPVPELQPETTYCFRLLAVRGELNSDPSNEICGPTTAAEPTASPTDGGPGTGSAGGGPPSTSSPPTGPEQDGTPQPVQFESDEWIAVVRFFPAGSVGARERADGLRQDLVGDGFEEAQVLFSEDYPDLPTTPSYLVYLGPFDSTESAIAGCDPQMTDPPADCVPLQPAPK
jgi:hypothetical protein